MFILPLMTDHLFWKAAILGDLCRAGPLYLRNLQCIQWFETASLEKIFQGGL